MESTNNQTPARSSEEQLKAKYGGKLYRVGITVPVDDESEKEFSYYFKRPTVPSYDRYIKPAAQGITKASKAFMLDAVIDEDAERLTKDMEENPGIAISIGNKLTEILGLTGTVETKELYYPQISAQAGSYTFEEGVELEIYSSKSSYYDWAKIRFTSQFRPKLSLKKKDPATIQLGYDGTLEDVFTGFVSGNYDGGTYANEVALKDEMLLMEETIINDTFLDTTPQELISYFLAQAGLSKMKLSSKTYPTRKMLPIRKQTAVQAINAVNAAWGLRVPFFFSGGVFYWDEKPEQKKVYTFERGVNILNLRRAGGVWELETVSAPFIKHSHKINLIHPQVSGEVEVSKVVSKTNDSGFIRTYIYF